MTSTRNLGGLDVPAIGFGAMVLSPGMYGEIDDDRAVAALDAAIGAGATFIDTSDAYGEDGHNEKVVGRVIRGRRDQVTVATKFGLKLLDGAQPHPLEVGFAFEQLLVNAEPKYIRGYADRSLANLGIDVIDLYYLHFPDPQVPIEDTVGAMAELVADGKVRYLGVSNVTPDELRRAYAVHPVAAVQTEWSMWRPIDPELLDVARELGVGVVPWSPLGAGFLTGTVETLGEDDFRNNAPRFDPESLKANNASYAALQALAADLGITRSQLALAWLLHQDPGVVPIPGSRTPAHIVENLAAAGITLHPDTLERIDAVLGRLMPVGGTLLRDER
ncbi:aryl-alcohol dehydrogenase-like predicted oxidoreductase [Kribbella aluminosa]|uniref:Aryl-alcohol dehydrogenase-like predicted oxidoreductase n=1 Tax=Kribbella aluminosa TaxID=416017 RepID=A0ABS4UIP5_9ACTN|nr:aldo/keto reductase [Kribbella aluminosa]MBP2351490.1 aryl-alcohol dehydrogenase-like predicted oxidoreductase [Kribbella aluminosa]